MQSIHGLAIQKQPVAFDGFGRVSNAKHPWLGYTQSWIQQKQPVEFDGFGRVANAKHPWLGCTQSWIQQKQLVEIDGFGTHGYMLYSLGYTVEYWTHQNQAKPGGFWVYETSFKGLRNKKFCVTKQHCTQIYIHFDIAFLPIKWQCVGILIPFWYFFVFLLIKM